MRVERQQELVRLSVCCTCSLLAVAQWRWHTPKRVLQLVQSKAGSIDVTLLHHYTTLGCIALQPLHVATGWSAGTIQTLFLTVCAVVYSCQTNSWPLTLVSTLCVLLPSCSSRWSSPRTETCKSGPTMTETGTSEWRLEAQQRQKQQLKQQKRKQQRQQRQQRTVRLNTQQGQQQQRQQQLVVAVQVATPAEPLLLLHMQAKQKPLVVSSRILLEGPLAAVAAAAGSSTTRMLRPQVCDGQHDGLLNSLSAGFVVLPCGLPQSVVAGTLVFQLHVCQVLLWWAKSGVQL